MKRLSGWDAVLLYSETPNVHMHTLKVAVIGDWQSRIVLFGSIDREQYSFASSVWLGMGCCDVGEPHSANEVWHA